MVEVQRGVASVAWLAEGVRPIRVCGNRSIRAAKVGRYHVLRRGEC